MLCACGYRERRSESPAGYTPQPGNHRPETPTLQGAPRSLLILFLVYLSKTLPFFIITISQVDTCETCTPFCCISICPGGATVENEKKRMALVAAEAKGPGRDLALNRKKRIERHVLFFPFCFRRRRQRRCALSPKALSYYLTSVHHHGVLAPLPSLLSSRPSSLPRVPIDRCCVAKATFTLLLTRSCAAWMASPTSELLALAGLPSSTQRRGPPDPTPLGREQKTGSVAPAATDDAFVTQSVRPNERENMFTRDG